MTENFKVLGRAADFADTANNTGYRILGRARDFTQESIQSIQNVANTALDRAAAIGSDIQETVTQTAADIGQQVSERYNVISDQASELAKSFGETVSGAASDVSAFINERVSSYLDTIQESEDDIIRAATVVGGMLAPLLPVNASKFAEFMANDGEITLTAEDLSDEDMQYLRDTAMAVIDRGDSKFTYEDWGYEEKNILMESNWATESLLSPAFRMATLIGQTAEGNVFINDDGDLIIRDRYDFNSGPRGTKLTEALALKEIGDMEGYERLRSEALDGLPYFGRLRVWAAALNIPQETGTDWEINLGPAPQRGTEGDG